MVHLFDDAEAAKNLATVELLARKLVRAGADRKALLVAVGGGVVGDVTGFVAAAYLRGVALVQVPTTLVAQVDSAVGGKTGVNLPEGKNLVGAFYPPRLVLADPEALRTLPEREFRGGLAEVIKYGVIADAKLFAYMEENLEKILLPGHALFRIRRGAFDYMQQREMRAMLLGEGESVSGSFLRTWPKVGREQNVLQLHFLFHGVPHQRTHRENRTVGLPENLLGNGTDQDLLDLAATVRPGHHEIDLVLRDQLFQGRPDVALFHQHFMGNAAEFPGDQNVRDAFFGGLSHLFVGGLCQLWLGKLKGVRRNDVGEVNPRIVALGHGNGVVQRVLGDFRKIGGHKNFSEGNFLVLVRLGLLLGLHYLRHDFLLNFPPLAQTDGSDNATYKSARSVPQSALLSRWKERS